MSVPLSQRSHRNRKSSRDFPDGGVPYGKAAKSARRWLEGEAVEREAHAELLDAEQEEAGEERP